MTLGLIRLEKKSPVRRKWMLAYFGLIVFGLSLIGFYLQNNYWKDAEEEHVAVTPVAPEKSIEIWGEPSSAAEETEKELKDDLDGCGEEITGFYECENGFRS